MGQKVHPYGFRLGVIYPWKSNWYASRRDYIEALHEDVWIRKHIRSRLSRAGISSIDIERKGDQIWVYIRTARPGIVIGRKGAEVDRLRKDVERYTKKRVDVKVEDMNQASSEVRPDTDAALLAQGVAEQLAGHRFASDHVGTNGSLPHARQHCHLPLQGPEAGLLQSRIKLDGDAIPERLIRRQHRAHFHGAQGESPIRRLAKRLSRIVLKRPPEVFVGDEPANQ